MREISPSFSSWPLLKKISICQDYTRTGIKIETIFHVGNQSETLICPYPGFVL
ncbi:MAG: hypothetical protein OP8BY_0248 [Candidatus Saccharicenans subterraneus]|uniref:Uncharacterized protein n=1 Tax=Candidatus Saccharicenans subterraneus TaxID=2508984 RepID=A0A3E2BLI0_9BACT|nr:MAG: hypothetical protein OP8BY_0248 [Candidatus Saccharicenans subterraneum]